jgi:hypothetical protein
VPDTPDHQDDPHAAEEKTDKDIPAVVGPKPVAIPEPPPPEPEQPKAAKRTRWTHDPAIFWVTLAGVVAVVTYTIVAAWQVHVMSSQLDEMKVQRIASQRAFITAKGVEFEPVSFLGKKGIFWIATPVLENSGNSPTADLIAITHCAPSFEAMNDPSTMEKTNPLYASRTLDFRHMVFGPKQVSAGGFCAVSSLNALFSMVPGEIHLYVYGTVAYHDIFDSEHWHETYYCFDSMNFALGDDANNPKMTAFTVACRSRNCVDEECSTDQRAIVANFMERKVKVFRMPTVRRLMEKAAKAAQSPPAADQP